MSADLSPCSDPSLSSGPSARTALRRLLLRTLVVGSAATLGVTAVATPAQAEDAREYVVIATTERAADAVADKVDGETIEPPAGTEVDTRLVEAELTASEADRLEQRSDVQAVVPNIRVALPPSSTRATTASSVPWGLDRIDQRSRTLDGRYTTPTTGAGTTVVVIDSGINLGHTEFTGRILTDLDLDFVDGDNTAAECSRGPGAGHGTHVAGTAAGSTVGVAPEASILPLRVFNCNGEAWFDDLWYAFDYTRQLTETHPQRMVVNYSGGAYTDQLGPGGAEAVAELEAAVQRVIDAGVPVVTAAGNDDRDACLSTPGRVPGVINVSATDRSDRRSWFSDAGRCADLFAPGSAITSAWIGSSTALRTIDGTSMAAPHATGVVARLLERRPKATPADVAAAISTRASAGYVSDTSGTPNRLLYADVDFDAPTVPLKVTVSPDHDDRRAVLRWEAPQRSGTGAVTGYTITRSSTDAAGKGPLTTTVSASTRSYTLTNLVPGRGYTVTIQAKNRYGAGAKATVKASVLALPGKPARPTISSGSTKDSPVGVSVSWKAPTTGGKPTSYMVTVRRLSNNTTKSVTVPASSTSVKITGLVRNQKYVASVRGINAAGRGSASTLSASAVAR